MKTAKRKSKPRRKAVTSPNRYIRDTVRVVEGMGVNGSKPRPFNARLAIQQFRGWAYAAATFNSSAVAGVPLRLYTWKGTSSKRYETRAVSDHMKAYFSGRGMTRPTATVARKAAEYGGNVEEVVDNGHPILRVLQNPNPFENGYELAELRILDQQFTGNAYHHNVLDAALGIPSQLWRMPAHWTKVIPSPTGFIVGYSYGQLPQMEDKYAVDEVLHFKMPNMADVHYGMGWVEGAWSALGLHNAKREMDTAKADNYARPDWLLSYEGGNPQQLDRIESKINEKLRGTDKTGKFLVSGGKVTATPLNFEEKEWGTGTRIVEEISAASKVPVSMLLSNDPVKANAETARVGWYRTAILPYCERDQEKFNQQFVPMFGTDVAEQVFLCYDQVCFEDRAALVKEEVAKVAGGISKPNESRAVLGLPQLDDEEADQLYPPSGNAGTSAVTGDTAVGQNTDRQNQD